MSNYSMLWPEGRRKALTFSYDDGVFQDRRLIAIMRANGLKGTFNLNSGFLGWKDDIIRDGRQIDHSHIPPEEVARLYEGFEVAVHTVSHPDLTALSDEAVLYEVLTDRVALERLVGYPVRGMAYPFGTTDRRVRALLAHCGIRFARGVRVTGDFSLPQDSYDWACSCHHEGLEPLIAPFLEDDGELKLLSVWGHSYEFDQKDSWPVIEAQMERLGGHADVWYAENSQVFDYIAAFKALNASADGTILRNESALTLWICADGETRRVTAGETVRVAALAKAEDTARTVHPFRIWKG